MNKVLTSKSTNKISCLNLAAYNLAAYNLAAYNLAAYKIKAFNKDFIPYNHFKGSKQAFNSNICKSIKSERFCRVARLKRFKRGTNKKVRLKIYKWGLVEKVLLISSFDWSNVITKKVWSKKPKLTQMT
jgi:hypothetical protein